MSEGDGIRCWSPPLNKWEKARAVARVFFSWGQSWEWLGEVVDVGCGGIKWARWESVEVGVDRGGGGRVWVWWEWLGVGRSGVVEIGRGGNGWVK